MTLAKGTCPGDSGAPLIKNKRDRSTLLKEKTLVAVLHGGLKKCDNSKYPAIYTRITTPHIWNWIMDDFVNKVKTTTQSSSTKTAFEGEEQRKHNCSVFDVAEILEVCTPIIETTCKDVALPIKIVVDLPYTYTVTRTICNENIDVVPNEVCSYSNEQITEDTIAKTGEVTFEKAVDQETAYNYPIVTSVDVPVTVAYPVPIKTCVDKPIYLPVVTCAEIQEERTIQVPRVSNSEVFVTKCIAGLGVPACQKVELTLPKQACEELFYNSTIVPSRRTGLNKRISEVLG